MAQVSRRYPLTWAEVPHIFSPPQVEEFPLCFLAHREGMRLEHSQPQPTRIALPALAL
jgi:hypothetical protein